jgi:hypothetical protein
MLPPVFILTRYLYIKEDVWASLMMSVLNKDVDQTLFWVCEMYYSGFEEELAEYLIVLYIEFFRSKNPRLEPILRKMAASISEGAHIAASMAVNMTAAPRKFVVQDFTVKRADADVECVDETRIIIRISPDALLKYQNVFKNYDIGLPARKILQKVCTYSTRKDLVELFQSSHNNIPHTKLCEYHRTDHNWLYFASFSPIWANRIAEYDGVIDNENCRVDFPNDDCIERFYEEYGYEPDEQKMETLTKFMHFTREPQLTMKAICCMFNPTKSVRVKRPKNAIQHA